jgi:hypothetical protein
MVEEQRRLGIGIEDGGIQTEKATRKTTALICRSSGTASQGVRSDGETEPLRQSRQALHEPRPNHSPDSMRRSHGVESQPCGSRMPGDTSRLTQAATRTALRFMAAVV